jgi:hypothetical protein
MKSSFKELVEKMQALEDDKQGKLRGGFAVVASVNSIDDQLASNQSCSNTNDCRESSNTGTCTNSGTC